MIPQDQIADQLKKAIQILPNSVFKVRLLNERNGIITFHEGAIAEQMNITTEKVQEQSLDNIFAPSIYAHLLPYIKQLYRGHSVNFELSSMKRYYQIYAQPYAIKGRTHPIQGEKPQDVVGYITEITEKKKASDRIKVREEQLSSLINAIPDFVFLKDGEGRWLETNQHTLNFFQLSHINYRGKTDRELAKYTKDFKVALLGCEDSDEQAWKAAREIRVEERILLPDKTEKVFDVVKVPIFYQNGDRKGLVVIGREITERIYAEEALRKAETMNVVGELAAGVAHEIRNPLTALKGFVQLFRTQVHNAEQCNLEYINIMLSEIDRIESIISEFLILAKPQTLNFQLTDLTSLVKKTVALFDTQAILNNVQIHLQIIEQVPHIHCEENQIKQVLINLLKNATEAMPDGGNIHINLHQEGDAHVKISVKDEGTGIPGDRLEQLGQPFYTTKEKGTGLGLMVSYRIVKHHQGDIKVTSEENIGTQFDILLPIEPKKTYT